MDIKRVRAIVFSGAGTTMTVARRFCDSVSRACLQRGMKVDVVVDDVTPASATSPSIGEGELVAVAVPSYGGRIPAPMVERLGGMAASDTPATMLVTYGNRAVDDTFLELSDVLEGSGFVPVSGAAVVAHHSLMTNVAQGRPNEDDLSVVDVLAEQTVDRVVGVAHACEVRLENVPGNHPYREFGGVPFKPEADKDLCVSCGACVIQCPVGAIDAEDPTVTDADACISCMRCIDVCPRGARKIGGGLALSAARKAFAVKCAKRQKSYQL